MTRTERTLMENKKNSLSMANFKNDQNQIVEPSTLNNNDFIDYTLSLLLKSTIEVTEMAIGNDRIFTRSKYEIMKHFHEAQSAIHSRIDKGSTI